LIASWSWTADDLVRDVRAREDRHGPVAHERRQPVAGRRVEPLREAEDRGAARQRGDDVGERGARHRDHDEVRSVDRRLLDRRRADAREVDGRQVTRVAPGVPDRLGLRRVATGERHRMAVVAEQARERGAPRAAADDDDVHHSERWKSIDTGTPWSWNRARSSFSTQ
jgi:hypothetical protein